MVSDGKETKRAEENAVQRPWLLKNTKINDEWIVLSMTAMDLQSQQYLVKKGEDGEYASMLLRPIDRTVTAAFEQDVSVQAKLHGSDHFIMHYETGRYSLHDYMIIELVGPTLEELRQVAPNKTFSRTTVFLAAVDMLQALQSLHNNGFIHRNINPSSFVLKARGGTFNHLCIWNFANSASYYDFYGDIKPPWKTTSTSNNSKYASADQMRNRGCSRKDDLWSVIYVLIEMSAGELPWSALTSAEEVIAMKETIAPKILFENCPRCFNGIRSYLVSLNYYSCPKYMKLINVIDEGLILMGESRESKPDWVMKTPEAAPAQQ